MNTDVSVTDVKYCIPFGSMVKSFVKRSDTSCSCWYRWKSGGNPVEVRWKFAGSPVEVRWKSDGRACVTGPRII